MHDLEDLLAGVGAVFRVAVDRNGLLERADVVLAMDVHTSPGHLGYLPDGRALASDYGPDHVRLDEDTQGEVGLAGRAGESSGPEGYAAGSTLTAIATPTLRRRHLYLQRSSVVLVPIQLASSSATSHKHSFSTISVTVVFYFYYFFAVLQFKLLIQTINNPTSELKLPIDI